MKGKVRKARRNMRTFVMRGVCACNARDLSVVEWSIGAWKGAVERVSFKDAKVFNHFFQAN